MGYMTPYYFSASAGQEINFWLRSYDFPPYLGLATSGSTVELDLKGSNSWKYNSKYYSAAMRYNVLSTDIYNAVSTTFTPEATGSFSLYISQGATSSIVTNNVTVPNRLIYSPNSNKIFSVEWTFVDSLNANVTVINPQSNVIDYSYDYTNTCMFDGIYNSVDDRVYVWLSSSAGEFLNEYSPDGSSVIVSHSIATEWLDATLKSGWMEYNADNNNIILVPSDFADMPLSYSIFDCNTHVIVHSNLEAVRSGNVTYVSSNNQYYISPTITDDPHVKVNGTTYSQSLILTEFSSSRGFMKYVPELNILVGRGISVTSGHGSASIFSPTTDTLITRIAHITDVQGAIYDACKSCIVIANGDDDNSFDGGLCYVSTGSYLPLNFIYLKGAVSIVFCDGTSTTWAANYYDDELISVFTSIPTGSSVPQPPLPPEPQPPAFCVVPPFPAYIMSGSIGYPISTSFVSSGTGSLGIWARSSQFDTFLNVYDPLGNLTGSNDWGGFVPSGDIDDAALNVPLNMTGTYQIQLSSSNELYDGGNFKLYISPGATRKAEWGGRYGQYVFWISSSNTIGVVGIQNDVVFYDVSSSVITHHHKYDGTYGGAYSLAQDRVFAWASGPSPAFENLMIEYDVTGSQVTSTSFDAQISWGGTICYDNFNDRFFLTRTFGLYGPYAIWDCATRTIIQSGSIDTFGNTSYCTYANVNNKYYTSFHNLSNNEPLSWVDASTYATGSTITEVHDYIQYEPATKQIAATTNAGVIIFDPVGDTTTTTVTSNNDTFEGIVVDPCTDTVVLAVDFGGAGGLIVLNPSASYELKNYIPLFTDTTEYMYGLCHAESTSRLYITSDDYNTDSSSLWDCKISIATASIFTSYPSASINFTGEYVGPFANGATIDDAAIGGAWGTSTYYWTITNLGTVNTTIVDVQLSNTDFSASYYLGTPLFNPTVPFVLTPINSYIITLTKDPSVGAKSSVMTMNLSGLPFTLNLSAA